MELAALAVAAPPPRLRSQVEAVLGPVGDSAGLSARPFRIVWVWSAPDGHPAGSHEFPRNRDLWLGLFRALPNVTGTWTASWRAAKA